MLSGLEFRRGAGRVSNNYARRPKSAGYGRIIEKWMRDGRKLLRLGCRSAINAERCLLSSSCEGLNVARSLVLAAVCVFGWTTVAEAQFGISFGGTQRNNAQGGFNRNQGNGPVKPNTPRFQGPNNSGQFNNQTGFNNNNNPFGGLIGAVANAATQAQQQQQFQPQNQFRPQGQGQFQQGHFHQPQGQFQQFQGDGFVQPQTRAFAPQVAASVEPTPTYSNLPIVLRCSSTAVNQCNYKLTEATGVSYPYNIAPGKKQVFNETTRWELSFDRGDGQLLRYTLSGGEIYELKQVDGLWVCQCAS